MIIIVMSGFDFAQGSAILKLGKLGITLGKLGMGAGGWGGMK
jgi:hypothetical protein